LRKEQLTTDELTMVMEFEKTAEINLDVMLICEKLACLREREEE
jgi:hypothetical protein